jgi:hypothetical protein
MKAQVECPYCDHKYQEDFDLVDFNDPDGTETDLECPKCKKIFCADVTVSIDVFEEAYEDDDEEEPEET